MKKLVRESLNEEYGDAEHKAQVSSFLNQIAEYLETNTLVGKKLTNIEIENLGNSGIVSALFTFDEVQMEIHIQFQDERRINDPGPKWNVEVALVGIKPKRGSFAKTLTGRNATPENAWKMLKDIFNLKYNRR